MNTIGSSAPLHLPSPTPASGVARSDGGEFKNLLLQSIREVNDMQQQADRAVERMAAGEDVTPAEVLTAVQKADIAFKLMMQVRNKLVQAYQEIQNVRI
ncbi:MAG: flagellar hook-basal body complex protein FliE [Planctomycetota bacterium]|nr:MAG: flagellar hook-basal body complex protein FliE [Planctomycetota bacterium]